MSGTNEPTVEETSPDDSADKQHNDPSHKTIVVVETIIKSQCDSCDTITVDGRDEQTYEVCRNCPRVQRVSPIAAVR
jgi:hypothetical protein